ncbi:transposase [Aeromicrobium sp. YIM 150415]|uniref:transposase n=1 Tax=Aeromicrobium sp. YIM 150415 TaxID=2803912 RepID=UPI0035ABE8EC
MTDTTDVIADDEMIDPVAGEIIDQKELAERLLAQAKEQGVSLVGLGGQLNQLTKNVLETAPNAGLASRITEKATGELAERVSRPLDSIYPVIFVDAIVVKVRDGQVRNTLFYVVMGVTVNGERNVLGIWAGDGAKGAQAGSGSSMRLVASVAVGAVDLRMT